MPTTAASRRLLPASSTAAHTSSRNASLLGVHRVSHSSLRLAYRRSTDTRLAQLLWYLGAPKLLGDLFCVILPPISRIPILRVNDVAYTVGVLFLGHFVA